jgi:hypothetical protein
MTDRRNPNTSIQDHDLLIELRTEMQGVRSDLKEIKDGTALRLSKLEEDHVSRTDFNDHENRMRFMERYIWGAIAIIGLINLVGFGLVVTVFNH